MSKQVFVIRDQENRYYTKKRKWRSGADNTLLFRSPDKDVALNELIEVNARDILARLELLCVDLDSKKHPIVEVLTEDPPELDAEVEEDDECSAAAEENAEEASDKPHLELVVSHEQAQQEAEQSSASRD